MPKTPSPLNTWKFNIDHVQSQHRNRVEKIKITYAIDRPMRIRYSISSFMMSIISMINFLEDNALKCGMEFGKNFFGITGDQLSGLYEDKINKDTVYDNLYRLVRLKFLNRFQIREDDPYYYYINKDYFLCHNGICMYKDSKTSYFSIGFCDICHYCNYNASLCIYDKILENKLASYLDFTDIKNLNDSILFQSIKSKIKKWKYDEEHEHLYRSELETEIELKKPIVKSLEKVEVYYYYDLLKKVENKKGDINKIKDDIIDILRSKRIRKKSDFVTSQPDYKKIIEQYHLGSCDSPQLINDEWGINPLMMSIVNLINLGREDSRRNPEIQFFPGFSTYDFQKCFEGFWISNETIYDNLYKLQRMNLLVKYKYDEEEISTSTKNEFWYDLYDNRFPCIGGIYILYYEKDKSEYKIYNGICPYHHFCNEPKSLSNCKLLDHLKNTIQLFAYPKKIDFTKSPFITYFQNKFDNWSNEEENFSLYKKNLELFIDGNILYINSYLKDNYDKKRLTEYHLIQSSKQIFEILSNIEILYFGKSITQSYEDDLLIQKFLNQLIEIFVVTLIKLDKKKKKKDLKVRRDLSPPMSRKDLLKQLETYEDNVKISL